MEKEEIKSQHDDTDNLETPNNDREIEQNLNTEDSDHKKDEKNKEDEVEELKEKISRIYAEMENQRRRYEKEKDEAFEYGGFGFAKETLSLLDNLERSKTSLENDDNLKGTDALKKLIEHIDIINTDMITIFKKNNIEPIEAINKKLDPNLHQAMMEVEDNSKEPTTIVQEIQKGFMMKDRLLRPSLVAVTKKSKSGIDNYEKSHENKEKKETN